VVFPQTQHCLWIMHMLRTSGLLLRRGNSPVAPCPFSAAAQEVRSWPGGGAAVDWRRPLLRGNVYQTHMRSGVNRRVADGGADALRAWIPVASCPMSLSDCRQCLSCKYPLIGKDAGHEQHPALSTPDKSLLLLAPTANASASDGVMETAFVAASWPERAQPTPLTNPFISECKNMIWRSPPGPTDRNEIICRGDAR
jgi:hypothetical protein